jgi:hypothetical protein
LAGKAAVGGRWEHVFMVAGERGNREGKG